MRQRGDLLEVSDRLLGARGLGEEIERLSSSSVTGVSAWSV
jgi:hypothetical protein